MASNDTVLVENPFGELGEDTLYNYDRSHTYKILMNVVIVTDIVKIILGLSVIVVNILLIYVISKFKRLKTTVNCYIKSYAISNILYLVSGSLVYIILDYKALCLVIQTIVLGLFLIFLFAFALGFDWLVMTFKPEFGLKIKNYYKFLTPAIYIVGSVKFLVLLIICLIRLSPALNTGAIFILGIYILLLLFILVLDYLNFRNKTTIRSTNIVYSLTIANIIVLSWLPAYIYNFLYVFLEYEGIDELILWHMSFIPELISQSVSIVILIVLVKVDKNFKMAFEKLFRRSVRLYSQDEDNLDDSEDKDADPNVFYNNADTCVKI